MFGWKGTDWEKQQEQSQRAEGGQCQKEEKVFQEKLAHMVRQTEPDRIQKERIWEKIVEKRRPKQFLPIRAVCAAACMLLVCLGGVIGVNAATGGAFLESVRGFCGLPVQQQEVAKETLALPNEVYAPRLVACSEDYVVFANERGLAIYSWEQDSLIAVLDLQEIECNYLNADTIETQIFMKNNILYIFNQRKSGKTDSPETEGISNKVGLAYTYDMRKAGEQKALQSVESAGQRTSIQKNWETYRRRHIRDTFDMLQDKAMDLNELIEDDEKYYSETCIVWENMAGNKLASFLVGTRENEYTLYNCSLKDYALEAKRLSVETVSAKKDVKPEGLPKFHYTGKNKVLAAACEEALKNEEGYYMEEGGVFIPAPVIFDTAEDDGDIIVFCNLWGFGYYQNGNTLHCVSGGEENARLRLTPDGNGGYKVTERLKARDGALQAGDLKKFCKGYPVSPDIYFDDEAHDRVRKKLIRMYVKDNHLDIQYYKDYGWDPVAIFD